MFNAVIQRFKEAQLQAFESYLMVARYEKEVFPVLEPSLRATRVKKEAELTCEFESFCMRIALAVIETVRSNVPAVVASGIDVASETMRSRDLMKALSDPDGAFATGKPPYGAVFIHSEEMKSCCSILSSIHRMSMGNGSTGSLRETIPLPDIDLPLVF